MKLLVRDSDDHDYIYGLLTINNKSVKKSDVQKKVHEFFDTPMVYGYTQKEMEEEGLTIKDLELSKFYDYTVDDVINFFPDEWETEFDNFIDEILV